MKEIQLNHGKVARVDDEWFEYLSQWKYRVVGRYAARWTSRKLGKRKVVFMHNDIMQPPPGIRVDHKDHDGFNNQTFNLRYCTNTQNTQNRRKQSNNRSGYKGVRWSKQNQRYRAQIVVNGEQIYLGVFKDPKEAARAYDRAALKYFGEFASLNFPE